MPSSVWMPCPPGWGQKIERPGPFSGWLGRKFDPLITGCELRDTYEPKDFYDVQRQPIGRLLVPGTTLVPEITLDRFHARRSLAEQLQRRADQLGASETYERFDAFQKKAFDILADTSSTDSPWRAFELSGETPAVRDRWASSLRLVLLAQHSPHWSRGAAGIGLRVVRCQGLRAHFQPGQPGRFYRDRLRGHGD